MERHPSLSEELELESKSICQLMGFGPIFNQRLNTKIHNEIVHLPFELKVFSKCLVILGNRSFS
jgi:hypothetical protein